MNLSKILKNAFLIILASLVLTACATKKTSTGQMQGDVYTGTDSVEYLALVFQIEFSLQQMKLYLQQLQEKL